MGIGIHVSSCSTGSSSCTIGVSSCATDSVASTRNSGNPDPRKFNILHHVTLGRYLVLIVQYPGCTTFEGKKVLVFRDVGIRKIRALTSLDPHFCDDPSHPSPVARFRPDDQGWEDAVRFCRAVG